MIPGSQAPKAVRACTIRFLSLGPQHHLHVKHSNFVYCLSRNSRFCHLDWIHNLIHLLLCKKTLLNDKLSYRLTCFNSFFRNLSCLLITNIWTDCSYNSNTILNKIAAAGFICSNTDYAVIYKCIYSICNRIN